MMVNIYGLIDPVSNTIRYIGNTKNHLYDRMKVHIYQSKNTIKPSRKEAWILDLLKSGMRPKIKLLERVRLEDRYDREIFLIKKYSEINELVNSSTGGKSGSTGTKHTEEWKNKNAKRMMGNKNGVGKKWSKDRLSKAKGKAFFNRGSGYGVAIEMYTRDMIFIREFKTISKASTDTGIHRASISRNLSKKIDTIHGYIFLYKKK